MLWYACEIESAWRRGAWYRFALSEKGRDSMKHASDFLKGATIEYGGDAQDNDDVVELFCIKMSSAGAYWFSVNLEFSDNGNDYVMIIGDFGAIGRDSLTYKSFNADEITEI
jgi:hypothetical protein